MFAESEVEYVSHAVPLSIKKNTSLILGTSQQVDIVESKLGKRGNVCINLSKSGNRIEHINKDIDKFYIQESDNHNIKNIILDIGVNYIRYCTRGINHLKSPLTNLIFKLKTIILEPKFT